MTRRMGAAAMRGARRLRGRPRPDALGPARLNDPSWWANLVPVNAVESVAEVLAEGIEPMTCTAVAPDVARRRREDQAVILPRGAAEGLSKIMRASQVPLRAQVSALRQGHRVGRMAGHPAYQR
jgi:hypothetical protein